MTLFLAGLVHIMVILGVHFEWPKPVKVQKSLEIELIGKATQKAPEQADFWAQENRIDSGIKQALAKPPMQPVIKQARWKDPIEEKMEPPKVKQKSAKPALVHKQADVKLKAASQEESEESRPRIDQAVLAQQIAQLGAQLSQDREEYAKRPKVMYINSVSAHKYVAASYERAWQEKVERIGNLNYPEEARRKNLTGGLLLSVGIKEDGSIYGIKVRLSSGEEILDDAAVRIVQLAAPFAPFPEELKRETDVLVITRTWKFYNDHRLSTSP